MYVYNLLIIHTVAEQYLMGNFFRSSSYISSMKSYRISNIYHQSWIPMLT